MAFSDEIGHFENCLQIDANFNCTKPGAQDQASGLDPDDGNNFCVPGTDSSLVKIDGCFSADGDWDGQSYQNDWPGTNPSPGQDRKLHPTPVLFTSPLTDHGTKNYSTIAFEADLPRIEASDSQDNPPFCDTTTGDELRQPAERRAVLSVLLDDERQRHLHLAGGWQLHSRDHEQFRGELDHRVRPAAWRPSSRRRAGPTTVTRYDNFNSGDMPNPCPVKGAG